MICDVALISPVRQSEPATRRQSATHRRARVLFSRVFSQVGHCALFFKILISGCPGSSLLCAAPLSLQWLLLVQSVASRVLALQKLRPTGSVVVALGLQRAGSLLVAHRFSCPAACGIFPDQGSNQCPLHCKADS